MVILDLDGTLIDSRIRLHKLFVDLVDDYDFPLNEYWRLKRRGMTHDTLLVERYAYREQQIDAFKDLWFQRIESLAYLKLDFPHKESTRFLEKLVETTDCTLLTARMNEEFVVKQLEDLGWISFFSDVIVTGAGRTKHEAASHLPVFHKDWLVGDTCDDIDTARKLGCRAASVSNGFTQHQRLQEHGPDVIAINLQELFPVLVQN